MKKICYIVTIPITIRSFFIPQLKYLAENSFEVSVVCSPDSKLQQELGERITYYPIDIPRGISVSGSIKAIRKLLELFKNEKYDLIQYSTPNAALYAAVAGKMAGIKVRNYHLMGFRYLGAKGFMRSLLKMMEKATCQLSTSIECVSKSNWQIGIEEKLFDKDKATVIWNGSTGGVDLHRFDISKREQYRMEIRNQFVLSSDEFVYGFVGRITRDKGVNEILEAFKHIENAKLMMIGSLEGIHTLDEVLYKDSINNSNIIYTGNVIEVEKYFAALDVLLLPSYREGFGNVVIEAAAMGTPAIVSDIPGPIDTIDPCRTALLIPVKNVGALQKAMMQIQLLDYVGMGVCAAKFVKEKFDSDILCKKIFERKQSLLARAYLKRQPFVLFR